LAGWGRRKEEKEKQEENKRAYVGSILLPAQAQREGTRAARFHWASKMAASAELADHWPAVA